MNLKSVVYPYSGILLSDKKEWTTDICNTDESQAHDVEQKKSNTKHYTICNASYVNFNLLQQKAEHGCLGLKLGGIAWEGARGTFEG